LSCIINSGKILDRGYGSVEKSWRYGKVDY
jgi:hypothetical protein